MNDNRLILNNSSTLQPSVLAKQLEKIIEGQQPFANQVSSLQIALENGNVRKALTILAYYKIWPISYDNSLDKVLITYLRSRNTLPVLRDEIVFLYSVLVDKDRAWGDEISKIASSLAVSDSVRNWLLWRYNQLPMTPNQNMPILEKEYYETFLRIDFKKYSTDHPQTVQYVLRRAESFLAASETSQLDLAGMIETLKMANLLRTIVYDDQLSPYISGLDQCSTDCDLTNQFRFADKKTRKILQPQNWRPVVQLFRRYSKIVNHPQYTKWRTYFQDPTNTTVLSSFVPPHLFNDPLFSRYFDLGEGILKPNLYSLTKDNTLEDVMCGWTKTYKSVHSQSQFPLLVFMSVAAEDTVHHPAGRIRLSITTYKHNYMQHVYNHLRGINHFLVNQEFPKMDFCPSDSVASDLIPNYEYGFAHYFGCSSIIEECPAAEAIYTPVLNMLDSKLSQVQRKPKSRLHVIDIVRDGDVWSLLWLIIQDPQMYHAAKERFPKLRSKLYWLYQHFTSYLGSDLVYEFDLWKLNSIINWAICRHEIPFLEEETEDEYYGFFQRLALSHFMTTAYIWPETKKSDYEFNIFFQRIHAHYAECPSGDEIVYDEMGRSIGDYINIRL